MYQTTVQHGPNQQVGMGQFYQRWAPLGPGGDPQLSLQGLGYVQRWAPLGPGGDPQMSLQHLGQEAAAQVATGFEAGGKVSLPPWTVMAALAAGLGLGALIGLNLRTD